MVMFFVRIAFRPRCELSTVVLSVEPSLRYARFIHCICSLVIEDSKDGKMYILQVRILD